MECGVRCVKCGVGSVKCGVWSEVILDSMVTAFLMT